MQHDKRQPVTQDVMAGKVAGGTGACAARAAAHLSKSSTAFVDKAQSATKPARNQRELM